MFQYYCLNPISKVGLEKFSDSYTKTETAEEAEGILVRSAAMHEMEFSDKLLCVARAGAGVNNIPLDRCAEKGIVVFNTPGANANGVKELVFAGMLLASRDIIGGINWVISDKGDENIAKAAEKEKKKFAGTEIEGKKLGIIGLGAIGVKVANAAKHLGMEVYGYDPYVSVDAAWNLSRDVKHVLNVEDIYENCDIITIHVPLLDSTKGMINKEAISKMKDGVILVNTSRGALVKTDDLIEGIRMHKFAGVGLDVYEEETKNVFEDRSDEILEHSTTARLLSFPNVMITSHQGFFTREAMEAIAETTLENALTYAAGKESKNDVK